MGGPSYAIAINRPNIVRNVHEPPILGNAHFSLFGFPFSEPRHFYPRVRLVSPTTFDLFRPQSSEAAIAYKKRERAQQSL